VISQSKVNPCMAMPMERVKASNFGGNRVNVFFWILIEF
jgi:hypothetical protein